MSRLLFIPVALVALVAAAMVWSRDSQGRPADFVFISRGDIGTLDPNSMSWLQDIRVAYALWEGLYGLDAQSLEAAPGCADRVDISADKSVYTFHIRPEARWCNGDAVVAGDFVFAWRRMLEQPSGYTYLLHYIKGARDYQTALDAGRPADFGGVGVQAIYPRTLRVTLNHPLTFFPELCAFPPLFPLHERSMSAFRMVNPATGKVSYDPRFTRPPHLVTNGPYRLAQWEFHKRLRLEASPCYWDRANVKSAVIDMLCYTDSRTAFLKYETGKIDWLAELAAEDASDLLERKRGDLRIYSGFATYYYALNCKKQLPDGLANPLADVRLRQALSMAIDKQPIVKNVCRLGQAAAVSYVPPGVFSGYRHPAGLAYDPQRARQLLAEAGYPGGRGLPKLSILFNNEGDHRFIAQIVRKQWLDVLGVEVDMGGVEIKTFRTRVRGRNYFIARASWFGDYKDLSTFTDKYLSDSLENTSGWQNAEYDRLCRQAAAEPDGRRRMEMLSQAEEILCREAPIIPLYHYLNYDLVRPGVKGVSLSPRNMVMFKAVQGATAGGEVRR